LAFRLPALIWVSGGEHPNAREWDFKVKNWPGGRE
jgi:hypothetical protein